ncbi:MAG: sulfotransferase [Phycisphaerales bacterium]
MTSPDPQSSQTKRRPIIALPVAHLLALAPLDVWFRMLWSGRGQHVHPRYMIRLAGIGFTSLAGTMCSTPERFVFWVWNRFSTAFLRRNPEKLDHPPGVLIIVGYYRSGTTHAHNLIACDPASVTPRWYQALLGQGFVLSWTIARFLLVPFLGSSRPQDSVGFGPLWPAEDDFALAGWGACSTLPGRLIFPQRWSSWEHWNDLDRCSESQRQRWRRTVAGFAWKVTRGNTDKMLVLKTPHHGAHIAELIKVFGEHARFIHITRDPVKVIESNIRMHDALSAHLLEDPISATELRSRIVQEYLWIEQSTAEQIQTIPDHQSTHITHERLIANPIGELRNAYTNLGWTLSAEHVESMETYLSELGAYTPGSRAKIDLGTPSPQEPDAIQAIQDISPATQPAPFEERSPVLLPEPARSIPILRALTATVGAALIWGAFWIGIIWLIQQVDPSIKPRLDQLVWIGGSVIGMTAFKVAGSGSRMMSIVACLLTLIVFLAISFPITVINWNFAADSTRDQFIYHNTKGALHGVLSVSSIIFTALGMMTAWKHAGSTGPRPPGSG